MSFLNQLFGGGFSDRAARASSILDGDLSGMNLMGSGQQMDQATGLDERQRGVLERIGTLLRGHPAGMGRNLPIDVGNTQRVNRVPGDDFPFANLPRF